MGYVDAFLTLSDAHAVTTTTASTNVIDTLAEGQVLEPGAFIRVAVQTAISMTGASGTLLTELQTGDDTDFQEPDAATLVSSTIDEADLVAGKEILVFKLPKNLRRYIRVYYTPQNTGIASGNIDAHVMYNVDTLITDVEPA